MRERAVGLGREVDARVLAADLAERVSDRADVTAEGREAEIAALRAIATHERANERASERERGLDDVEERELRERRDHAIAPELAVGRQRARADRQRGGRNIGGRRAEAEHRAAGIDAGEERLTALPRIERATSEVEHALGEEEGVHLAEVDGAAADLGAHAAADEERMEVGALDARLERGRGRGAGTHRELRGEGDRRVAIDVDGHRRRRGHLGAEVGLLLASARRGRGGPRRARARGESRTAWRATRGVESIDDARAHLLEDDRAIVDEDGRLVAAAVDAERRGVREALDAELPRVLVEAHDALAASDADEVGERPREIAQHARRVTLRDARSDVRTMDEEVEDLVRPHAGSAGGGAAVDADAST